MNVHHFEPAATAVRRPEPELALAPPPSAAMRARQLMAEAREAALDHLAELTSAMEAARVLADSIIVGGDLYGVGVRDLANRLSEDLLWRSRSLQALADRERQGRLAH